jgi:DNA repair ATPase RecN
LLVTRRQGRVSKKELALKENRNEWEADTKALTLLKEGHEKEVQLHSEKLLKYEQFMDVIKSELICVESMETIISDHLSALNDAVLTESLSDVWEHQAEVVECQVSVDEAKEELRAALAGLEALREEVSQLEKRIPLLEQQKNAAVSARDFKAAGKASKDIKEAIARYDA